MTTHELMSFHPLLADRIRLSILAALASSSEPFEFTRLLEVLEVTRGNLSTHMRKLEEAEFVLVEKDFANRKPRTRYQISEQGRRELECYLESIERALRGVRRTKAE